MIQNIANLVAGDMQSLVTKHSDFYAKHKKAPKQNPNFIALHNPSKKTGGALRNKGVDINSYFSLRNNQKKFLRTAKFSYVVKPNQKSCLGIVHGGTLAATTAYASRLAIAAMHGSNNVVMPQKTSLTLTPNVAKVGDKLTVIARITDSGGPNYVGDGCDTKVSFIVVKGDASNVDLESEDGLDLGRVRNLVAYGETKYNTSVSNRKESGETIDFTSKEITAFSLPHREKRSHVEKNFDFKIKKASEGAYAYEAVMSTPEHGKVSYDERDQFRSKIASRMKEEYMALLADTFLAMAANQPLSPKGELFYPTGSLEIDYKKIPPAGTTLYCSKPEIEMPLKENSSLSKRMGRAAKIMKLGSKIVGADGEVYAHISANFVEYNKEQLAQLTGVTI